MLFLKTFKGAKFVVDGNAFQTFITLSTKNFCLMLAVLHACVLVVVYTCFYFYCTLCTVRLNNNNNNNNNNNRVYVERDGTGVKLYVTRIEAGDKGDYKCHRIVGGSSREHRVITLVIFSK